MHTMTAQANDGFPGGGLIDLDLVYLPEGSMRQLSRSTHLRGQEISGEVEVGLDHWVYAMHFPGDPIFPGCLMVEAAGQLVAAHAWRDDPHGRPRLVRANAEFRDPVHPDDELLVLEARVRKRRNLHFGKVALTADSRAVAAIDIVLAVLPPEPTLL
jgi:3-hydroxymyristoyl/3-hydroxydecanoyl-(acyl carrier protein) dehydratase